MKHGDKDQIFISLFLLKLFGQYNVGQRIPAINTINLFPLKEADQWNIAEEYDIKLLINELIPLKGD